MWPSGWNLSGGTPPPPGALFPLPGWWPRGKGRPRGASNIYCDARPIGHLPEEFKLIGTGSLATIQAPVFIMAVLSASIFVITRYTVFGRYVYAVGGNEEAARLSGINVKGVKFWVYVVSGMFAGICGIILASRLGSGDPKLGLMHELIAIAAVR